MASTQQPEIFGSKLVIRLAAPEEAPIVRAFYETGITKRNESEPTYVFVRNENVYRVAAENKSLILVCIEGTGQIVAATAVFPVNDGKPMAFKKEYFSGYGWDRNVTGSVAELGGVFKTPDKDLLLSGAVFDLLVSSAMLLHAKKIDENHQDAPKYLCADVIYGNWGIINHFTGGENIRTRFKWHYFDPGPDLGSKQHELVNDTDPLKQSQRIFILPRGNDFVEAARYIRTSAAEGRLINNQGQYQEIDFMPLMRHLTVAHNGQLGQRFTLADVLGHPNTERWFRQKRFAYKGKAHAAVPPVHHFLERWTDIVSKSELKPIPNPPNGFHNHSLDEGWSSQTLGTSAAQARAAAGMVDASEAVTDRTRASDRSQQSWTPAVGQQQQSEPPTRQPLPHEIGGSAEFPAPAA